MTMMTIITSNDEKWDGENGMLKQIGNFST